MVMDSQQKGQNKMSEDMTAEEWQKWRMREMRKALGIDHMLSMPNPLELGYERDDSNA